MTKKKTKITILSAVLAGGLSAGTWIGGCSTDPVEQGTPTQNLGSASIGLEIGNGVTLNTVTYTITGPAASAAPATSTSPELDGQRDHQRHPVRHRLPDSIKGTTTDGQGVCIGSATFDVTSARSSVPVHLTCNLQPSTGSVLVNGTLNACPRIDAVGASPAEAAVNGTHGAHRHRGRRRPRPLAAQLQLDRLRRARSRRRTPPAPT